MTDRLQRMSAANANVHRRTRESVPPWYVTIMRFLPFVSFLLLPSLMPFVRDLSSPGCLSLLNLTSGAGCLYVYQMAAMKGHSTRV